MKDLEKEFKPIFLVPFKNKAWFISNVVKEEENRVFDLDWFDSKEILGKVKFNFVPA